MKRIVLLYILASIGAWAQSGIQEADSLFKLGNYSKAIAIYKQNSQHHEASQKLALSYQALGNYQQGLQYYDKAVLAHPENLFLRYEQAKLLRALKKYDVAKEGFQTLIQKDSLNPNFYFEMGKLAEQTGDSLAINYFNKTYNLDPQHQKTIYKIARYKMVKRKHIESNEYVDRGLKLYSENVELISLKAQNFYWMQDYEKAIFWFEKLIALGEKSELIYEKLSISQAENYDYEKAIAYRKKALAYNPENADAHYAIGIYYEYLHKFAEAEEHVALAISLKDEKLSDEYQKLGVLLNRQKKYPQAIEAFKKSLKEDPTNMSSDFFMAMSKDQYYEDIDARIKVFKDLESKYSDSPFATFASRRLEELREEKFNTQD
ncbi:tetratricopeptide repeat protein [Winogradskyella aurantiaca]|uniref:tetratricopeptide repeat protein n=1 Tax=Winogradskyella aurantiaca TaxID=2219558 RepID=UPI000E1DF9B9|nr:tetratricopeptide repeat protein [Winogradskyella aurantiaca]